MKSFTTEKLEPRLLFEIDGDPFHSAAELPAGAARTLAKITKATDAEKMMLIGDFLDAVLLPDDAERFAVKISNAERPVSIEMLGQILEVVLEEYGDRPTRQPVPSRNGALSTGTSSMDGRQLEA